MRKVTMRVAVQAALQVWIRWLVKMHLAGPGGATYEPDQGIRSNTEHADRILSGLLLQERCGDDFPSRIHDLIIELPQPIPRVMAQVAEGHSQSVIANRMGLSQPTVSRHYRTGAHMLWLGMQVSPTIWRGMQKEHGLTIRSCSLHA